MFFCSSVKLKVRQCSRAWAKAENRALPKQTLPQIVPAKAASKSGGDTAAVDN